MATNPACQYECSSLEKKNHCDLLESQNVIIELLLQSPFLVQHVGSKWVLTTFQCGPLSLVEAQRGSALIGRELHSVAPPVSLMP